MNDQTRSRLTLPLVLGLLGGSAGLIGCQSSQPQSDDGPSGSGLLPPPPAARSAPRDWATPPWATKPLPLPRASRDGMDDGYVPPLPAA